MRLFIGTILERNATMYLCQITTTTTTTTRIGGPSRPRGF